MNFQGRLSEMRLTLRCDMTWSVKISLSLMVQKKIGIYLLRVLLLWINQKYY